MTAQPQVLIVGAGMSGIAAARTLVDAGFSVQVLEARDRLGGRIFTDREWSGLPIDLGASWIHGRLDNPLSPVVAGMGIQTRPTSYENIALFDTDGRRLGLVKQHQYAHRPNQLIKDLQSLAYDIEKDMTVREAVDLLVARMQPPLGSNERKYLNKLLSEFILINGADLEKQSLWSLIKFPPGITGRDALFPKHGFGEVVERLARGIDIKYGTRAIKIRQSDGGVQIESASQVYKSEYAIITLPLGVLKSGSVKFEPALPVSKQRAIDTIAMGLMNKVVLRFPHVFWPRHHDFIEFVQEGPGPFHAFLNGWKLSGQPVLVTFSAGQPAADLEKLTDEEIVSQVMALLHRLPRARDVQPTAVKITRWGRDENAAGAYSVVPLGADPQPFADLGSAAGRLFFAGEATELSNQGTAHGAYLSGLRAAAQVQDCCAPTPSPA
ncbi:MAG: FAD-dependent oxidoreductase [Candidatus Obscuribacterales bacterium]